MSAKNLDKHNRFRSITVGFRVSPEENEQINKFVAVSGLSKQEYCYRRCINVDDIIETSNHFRCIDLIIDSAKSVLNEKYIKELHYILKSGTADSQKDWFNVGEYKKLPTVISLLAVAVWLIFKVKPDLIPVDLTYPVIAVVTVCEAVAYWKQNRKWAYLLIAGAVISMAFTLLEFVW